MMTKEQKELLETAIVADLHNPALRHIDIAISRKIGLNFINRIAKNNGLGRKRGPRPTVAKSEVN
jgi:hypothetical protein